MFASMRTTDTFRSVTSLPLVSSHHSVSFYPQVGSLAWGVGCGNEIPSVYSKTSGSMCWIDWVMSCVPQAEYNIDYARDRGPRTEDLRDTVDGA